MNEKILEKIWSLFFIDEYIDTEKDNLQIAFVKGYVFGNKDFEEYISQYLWEYHAINPERNTWAQQVDHYAFEQGLDWYGGFRRLKDTLSIEKCPSLKYKPVYVYEGQEDAALEHIGDLYPSISLRNGAIVTVGDTIRLGDKIGEDYKKTKFYDVSLRNPSWELFYPSEKDFKHISFWYKGKDEPFAFNFGSVRRLFSHSIAKVEMITKENDVVSLYTNLFKIDIEKALETNEAQLWNKTDTSFILTNFSTLLCEIGNDRENGRLSTMSQIQELINYWCFFYFSNLKKEWHSNSRGTALDHAL